MSRIISVLNFKGGTGKTTTVVSLAAGLALRGARVLCIDLDAQGSLATYLGVQYGTGLTHLLSGEAGLSECIRPARKNLDLIPSDSSLLKAEGALWQKNDLSLARRALSDLFSTLDGYEYIFLDHSPSISLISEAGLLFAHELIVPVATNYLALIGVRQVIQTLKEIGRIPGHHLRLSLVVPTLYSAQLRKDREIIETLNRYFTGQVANPIRASVKLAEAPGHQQTIFEYAPQSYGAIDYACLVERIANHGG